VLIIRSDGTFDWTGSVEGMLIAMHQLEYAGDRSVCVMDPGTKYEVVSSRYTPTESALKVKLTWVDHGGEVVTATYALAAVQVDADCISASIEMEGPDSEHQRSEARLYRVSGCHERVGDLVSSLSTTEEKKTRVAPISPESDASSSIAVE
jgi:hypothetical protein